MRHLKIKTKKYLFVHLNKLKIYLSLKYMYDIYVARKAKQKKEKQNSTFLSCFRALIIITNYNLEMQKLN